LTWVQLERHDKPVVIADIGGFWRPLISLLAHMRNAQFIRTDLEVRYLVAERIEDCLGMIEDAARRRAVGHEPKVSVDRRM
jgi:predicted Rossmann-fold nucleotide-binding protein